MSQIESVIESPVSGYRYRATFKDGFTVDFGNLWTHYYIDSQCYHCRRRWLHSWNPQHLDVDPRHPAVLERYLLWEEKNIKAALSKYKRKFPDNTQEPYIRSKGQKKVIHGVRFKLFKN